MAERVAATYGMEVVDVEFQGSAKFRTLRVFLEKNEAERAKLVEAASGEGSDLLPKGVPAESLSGVTHEDCASFANDFGTLLDVEDVVPGSEYTLEVSSPGLERKLTSAKEFQRFTGSLIKLKTTEPINGNKVWQGRLKSFEDDTADSRPLGREAEGQGKEGRDRGEHRDPPEPGREGKFGRRVLVVRLEARFRNSPGHRRTHFPRGESSTGARTKTSYGKCSLPID